MAAAAADFTLAFEADENFDEEINPENRDECDEEVKELIFARSKCKSWATKTRRICTNFRASVMTAPTDGSDPMLKPNVGHMALQTAQHALADMTKYFRKLDDMSTKIIVVHGFRFLDADYETENELVTKTADKATRTRLDEEAQVFIDAYQLELNAMRELINGLEAKLHIVIDQPVAAAQNNGARALPIWKENRMFKPTTTLSTKTSPAEIDDWADSMETYADSSGIAKAPFNTQHAFMRTCVDETFWHTIKENLRDDAALFPPNRSDRGGESVLEKLREAHAVHNPIAANRLILFTRHQTQGQPFEEYQADMLWVYNRCNVATLTDLKLLSYLIFMGIRDDDLKEAIVTAVKGDDTLITVELMIEVAKTRTTFHVYKNMMKQKDQKDNVVGATGKRYQRGNGNNNPPPGAGSGPRGPPPSMPDSLKGLSGAAKRKEMATLDICYRCGLKNSICKLNVKCKALENTCRKCGKLGHHLAACLKPSDVKKVATETEKDEEEINEESD